MSRIEEVGDVGIDQFMQVLGFRLASIGRSQEKRHRKVLQSAAESTDLKGQLETKETMLSELKKEHSITKEKLKLEKEEHESAKESLGKKESELTTINERIVEVTLQLKQIESSREADILDAFAEGFECSVIQGKFLCPGGEFTAIDPSKIVRNGQLVDDEEVAEEGDDNLAD
ncbi:uncharacterized protein [Arachis hypogaea]